MSGIEGDWLETEIELDSSCPGLSSKNGWNFWNGWKGNFWLDCIAVPWHYTESDCGRLCRT
eukprot:4841383-Amphidinium_carterae.1